MNTFLLYCVCDLFCRIRQVNPKVVVKADAPVDTVAKISDVKQKTFTNFEVTMSKALETVTASDFTMVRDNDNQVITVKSASLDATDKTKVNLTVYTSLTDAKTYTVTYTAADEAKTQSSKQVTVTDGVVADVAITPVEITANQETLIEYQTLDATGVVISQKGVTKAESTVDVSWDSLLGTMNNDSSKYILYNEGDSAKFTVTYHTYKYDTTTGAELGVITKDFTVTAVKDASVVNQFAYTAALNKPFDWAKVTQNHAIALGDDGSNSAQRTAYFLIKDSKGGNVTDSCGYKVESSDNSVVVADGDVADGAKLSPVSKGSAFLMIKNGDGKVVSTLPITVGEKRTISTFKLSAPVVNVATYAAIANPETLAYTDIIAKDQYGEDITPSFVEDERKSGNNVTVVDLPGEGTPVVSGGTIRVASTGTDGYDNYIIKATDKLGKSMTTSLRVNSVKATSTPTYSVVFLNNDGKIVNSVDTTLSETNAAAHTTQTLNAVLVVKRNNVVVGAVASPCIRSLKVVKNDGSVVASKVSGSSVITSGEAIDATAIGTTATTGVKVDGTPSAANVLNITARETITSNTNKYLGAGQYTVYYELEQTAGKIDRASASFNVTDTQTSVTSKVKETNCGSANNLETVLEDQNNFVEYFYGDVKVNSVDVIGINCTKNATGNNVYVKSVTVKVPVAALNGTNGNPNATMRVTVSVNKTFTTTAGSWTTTAS